MMRYTWVLVHRCADKFTYQPADEPPACIASHS